MSDQTDDKYFIFETPILSRLSLSVRKMMFARFLDFVQPTRDMRVLDLGVTSNRAHPGSNFFEQLYPYKDRITCAGITDASHLEAHYPGVRFVRVTPGEDLPFADGEFDAVFSNAVVEHTGSRAQQRRFVHEICRVGKRFFVTTPNRGFPIEMHTGLPFVHYLRAPWHRAVLARLGFTSFAKERNLNLLGPRSLRSLFPVTCRVCVGRIRPAAFLFLASNLIAYGTSRAEPGRS